MIMKRWRVGTLTMGIVLVASGIMLMASLITKFSVLNILLTFWPVILICLGMEILLHLFVRKGEDADVKIRYDVLSVLFIGFVLFLSSLFYAATFSFELLGGRDDALAILGIRHLDAKVESSVELTGANGLTVFDGDWHMSIKIIHTGDESIRVDYRIAAPTNDMEYAIAALEGLIDIEHGERAYLMLNAAALGNYRNIGFPMIDCVIHLPQGKTLDISQFHGRAVYDPALEGQITRDQGF